FYGRGAARAHGAMQRRHAAVVDGIRVSAGRDQAGDRRGLCVRIPCARARAAVGGVMKRLGAAAIAGTHIGARGDEFLCGLLPVAGGGDMQRRVAAIQVVPDLVEEVRLCTPAGRPLLGAGGRELRRCGQQSRRGRRVAGNDGTHEYHERAMRRPVDAHGHAACSYPAAGIASMLVTVALRSGRQRRLDARAAPRMLAGDAGACTIRSYRIAILTARTWASRRRGARIPFHRSSPHHGLMVEGRKTPACEAGGRGSNPRETTIFFEQGEARARRAPRLERGGPWAEHGTLTTDSKG